MLNKSLAYGRFTSLASVAFRRRHFRLNSDKLLAGEKIATRGHARIFETLLGSNEAKKIWRDTMKKFLVATVGLVALGVAVPASAADLGARPYRAVPPPMVAAIYDWSGFYIGANGGLGARRQHPSLLTARGPF